MAQIEGFAFRLWDWKRGEEEKFKFDLWVTSRGFEKKKKSCFVSRFERRLKMWNKFERKNARARRKIGGIYVICKLFFYGWKKNPHLPSVVKIKAKFARLGRKTGGDGEARNETNIFTGNQRMGKIYINYWNVNKHFAGLLFLVKHRFAWWTDKWTNEGSERETISGLSEFRGIIFMSALFARTTESVTGQKCKPTGQISHGRGNRHTSRSKNQKWSSDLNKKNSSFTFFSSSGAGTRDNCRTHVFEASWHGDRSFVLFVRQFTHLLSTSQIPVSKDKKRLWRREIDLSGARSSLCRISFLCSYSFTSI